MAVRTFRSQEPPDAVRISLDESLELPQASEAARRLGAPTKALLELVHQGRIRNQMVDGIAHIPADALDEYQLKV